MESSFGADKPGLHAALDLLLSDALPDGVLEALGDHLPPSGIGELATLNRLAPYVLQGAENLGAPSALAHMDPPTPWITWATALWNASRNQNLLHPATSPAARQIETTVVDWLAPFFGMNGGHMTPGSTVANLTALWAARELKPVRQVVAGTSSHLSIKKAAHLLGLDFISVPAERDGSMQIAALPADLSEACLVLTVGTTSTGAVDDLWHAAEAAWVHVDAAWAGPLRLTDRYAGRLGGIERADSVAVSAHKWLFQPKESALIFFKDESRAHQAISFGGDYLAVPNVGLLGSHGATAVPLLATCMALGRDGLCRCLEKVMAASERLAEAVLNNDALELLTEPRTGVVVWRAKNKERTEAVAAQLPAGFASTTMIDGECWFRNVAANPNADIDRLVSLIGSLS